MNGNISFQRTMAQGHPLLALDDNFYRHLPGMALFVIPIPNAQQIGVALLDQSLRPLLTRREYIC
jgi:hypothetical protein